jgi:hypothetical protein
MGYLPNKRQHLCSRERLLPAGRRRGHAHFRYREAQRLLPDAENRHWFFASLLIDSFRYKRVAFKPEFAKNRHRGKMSHVIKKWSQKVSVRNDG